MSESLDLNKTRAGVPDSGVDRKQLGWFHRYPARFSRDVVAQMLEGVNDRLGATPSLLLDPFAGTGTTIALARQQGVASLGIELSHLGVLVGSLRLDPPQDVDRAVAQAGLWADEAIQRDPAGLPEELIFWLGRENTRVLAGFLSRLARVRDRRRARFLKVAISSALRPASRWLPGSIKPQIDPERAPSPIAPT